MRASRSIGFALLVVVFAVLGGSSRAQAMSLYVGGLGGYGFATENAAGTDPFGLAYGLDAGLTLPIIPFYVGGRVLLYSGSKHSLPGGGDVSREYRMFGVDLGYEASAGPIVLRPTVSIGSAALSVDLPSGSTLGVAPLHSSLPEQSTLYVSPGVALLFKAGLLYVGGEARYNILTRHNHPDGATLLASIGLTL
jgi:hypothetical protein